MAALDKTDDTVTDVRDGVDRETVEAVQAMAGKYKYGWETEIETEYAPKGLNEDIVRLISAKNGEPEWMTDWRLAAYPALAADGRAALGDAELSRDRLSGSVLLRQAEEHGGKAEKPGRGRPEAAGHLRKAGHPAERADDSGGRRGCRGDPGRGPQGGGRCGFRLGVGRHHLQGGTGQGRRDLHADLGGDPRTSRAGAASTSARSCRSRTISLRR